MKWQSTYCKAEFAAGETTATYSVYQVDGDGSPIASRARTGMSALPMIRGGAMMLAIPSDIAAGVATIGIQFQLAAGSTWYDALDTQGEAIQIGDVQTNKGKLVAVNLDAFAGILIRLAPVDGSGDPAAPGAVIFEMSIK